MIELTLKVKMTATQLTALARLLVALVIILT